MESPSTALATIVKQQGRRSNWLAQSLGVDPSTVCRWLAGEREIPSGRVTQLAALLGVAENQIRMDDGLSTAQRQPSPVKNRTQSSHDRQPAAESVKDGQIDAGSSESALSAEKTAVA